MKLYSEENIQWIMLHKDQIESPTFRGRDIENGGTDISVKFLKDVDGQFIPYINIGKEVQLLNPIEFKRTYKGPFSNYFRYIVDKHNLYLGAKNIGQLIKNVKNMNVYGYVYVISLIKDETSRQLSDGPVLIYNSSKKSEGDINRVGRAVDLKQRIRIYRYESKVNRRNLHFENAFNKYGPRAFKIRLLAICKSEKEYKFTEYFWTLFFNKKATSLGYDLKVNSEFNPLIGSIEDSAKFYQLPKWQLVNNILDGLERSEIDALWEEVPLGTVKLRLVEYFGHSNLYRIKLSLVAPYIDTCLKRGYIEGEAIQYLISSGFIMFNEETYRAREETFGKDIKRTPPIRLFRKMIKDLHSSVYLNIPIRNVGGKTSSYYEQLRLELFIKPFSAYLRNLGIKERISNDLFCSDYSIEKFEDINQRELYNIIDEFSIIEHLIKRNVGEIQIAYALGLCSVEDTDEIKNNSRGIITGYLNHYKRRLSVFSKLPVSKISYEDVRLFIISHYLGSLEYYEYLIRLLT